MISGYFPSFTSSDIASALNVDRSTIVKKGKLEKWENQKKGNKCFYFFEVLPEDIQYALLTHFPERFGDEEPDDDFPTDYRYDPDELWEYAETRTQKARDKAADKLKIYVEAVNMHRAGMKIRTALRQAAEKHGLKERTLVLWHYGRKGRPGLRHYRREDWLAALIDANSGCPVRKEIDPRAWDFFKTHHLSRSKPSVADSYRRTVETAEEHGWAIASYDSFRRRLENEVAPQTRVYMRDGAKALRTLYPAQVRDKTVFSAGEAVVGDGLKLDRLWVDWGDEIINTTTVWVWADIYSGKILAHRVGKTENTDIFRLATYDLTKVTVPRYAWVDNTRVAANKAMTGQSPRRHRFKTRPDDPVGVLIQLGIDVRFTNPDQTVSNPGVKPIERAFGKGGLHEMVATHPRFYERGFSKATAVPIEEVVRTLGEEIARFNARIGRRSGVCNGRSFDETYAAGIKEAPVRKVSEAKRRLLLLLPEVITAQRGTGEITLQAGKGPHGRHRYWNETLVRHSGTKVVAYYDPQDFQKDTHIYTLDGRHICDAQWIPSVAFNDTETAREWTKNKKRYLKAQRAAAKAESRMSHIEMAGLYPSPDKPEEPSPKVINTDFKKSGRPEIDDWSEEDRQQAQQLAVGAEDYILKLHEKWQQEKKEELPT